MKKIEKLLLALALFAGGAGLAGCKRTVYDDVELEKIEITAQANKTEYFAGEELDTTGLEITAVYTDGTKKVVENWTTTGYDSATIGEQTITVSYTEDEITKTASYKVTVKEVPVDPKNPGEPENKDPSNEPPKVELTEIEITTQPSKKEYFVDAQELDLAGLKVTATYNDGTTKDVTADVTTSGFDSSAATESQTITVTYGGKTATFTVKIKPLLTGIEITNQPTKKEYFLGASSLDLAGLKVTATYNDGTTKDVTADVTTSGFDSSAATDSQTITVTYEGKTATFTVKIKPFNWYETPEQLPAGTNGTYGTEGTYVLFGVWPQDVVPVADVETLGLETSTDKVTRGYMEYVKGSDGNYYVKCAENANDSGYKYKKDDSDVKQGGTTSRWFKVMPIKWRVVDTAYDVDGSNGSETSKLLVAENILTANVPYYEDYQNNRTIDEKTVYPNNYMHSQIRAYLNGISYNAADSENNNKWYDNANSKGKGFLQTAFGDTAQQTIITTEVNNSGESTTDVGKNLKWANGKEKDGVTDSGSADYTCENTQDKIFLLSEYEVTKYSKEAYNAGGKGNSRIRVTTDFAKANYAYQSTTDGYGGYWWLRSPYYSDSNRARIVYSDGPANYYSVVHSAGDGVVPALSISF